MIVTQHKFISSKRIFDLSLTIPGLLILSPVLLLSVLAIKIDSKGAVIFRQKRVGLNGKIFEVLKLRTMVIDAENKGGKITTSNDVRITKVGAFLRNCKLDELPQLFNVLKGDMSLVGPRPEVPEYVKFYPENMKKIILSVPPGITDKASIEYKDENKILANSVDPIKDYQEKILPIKLDYYRDYVLNRSLLTDIGLILSTIYAIARG
jgi:lipopolysaccharide/colanic/teichoic acid biosynthesis glycosyltransferase